MSGELEVMTTDELVALAWERGCTVVGPYSGEEELRTVLLDMDGEGAMARYRVARDLAQEVYPFAVIELWDSATAGNKHMKITLEKPVRSHLELVALQLALGSDPKRELFALRRLANGHPMLNTLFRPLMANATQIRFSCKEGAL